MPVGNELQVDVSHVEADGVGFAVCTAKHGLAQGGGRVALDIAGRLFCAPGGCFRSRCADEHRACDVEKHFILFIDTREGSLKAGARANLLRIVLPAAAFDESFLWFLYGDLRTFRAVEEERAVE